MDINSEGKQESILLLTGNVLEITPIVSKLKQIGICIL